MNTNIEILKIMDWVPIQARIQISERTPYPKRREI